MKPQHSIKNIVSEISELPKDVILDVPLITLYGNGELQIENYCGIIEYTSNLIRIRTKEGQIHILGKELKVNYYLNSDMKVQGNIETIQFRH